MRETINPNLKSGKRVVLVSRGVKPLKRQRRQAPARQIDMSRFASMLLLLQLAAAPLAAQEFMGQVGRIDEAQLGFTWWRIPPGEYPMLPESGVRVRVVDCEEDCPDPVVSDPAGNFRFAGLASSAKLRFEQPECAVNDFECEPLQPREVERQTGARTALSQVFEDSADAAGAARVAVHSGKETLRGSRKAFLPATARGCESKDRANRPGDEGGELLDVATSPAQENEARAIDLTGIDSPISPATAPGIEERGRRRAAKLGRASLAQRVGQGVRP